MKESERDSKEVGSGLGHSPTVDEDDSTGCQGVVHVRENDVTYCLSWTSWDSQGHRPTSGDCTGKERVTKIDVISTHMLDHRGTSDEATHFLT